MSLQLGLKSEPWLFQKAWHYLILGPSVVQNKLYLRISIMWLTFLCPSFAVHNLLWQQGTVPCTLGFTDAQATPEETAQGERNNDPCISHIQRAELKHVAMPSNLHKKLSKGRLAETLWSQAVFAIRFLSWKTERLEKAMKIQEPVGEREGLFAKDWVSGNLLRSNQ